MSSVDCEDEDPEQYREGKNPMQERLCEMRNYLTTAALDDENTINSSVISQSIYDESSFEEKGILPWRLRYFLIFTGMLRWGDNEEEIDYKWIGSLYYYSLIIISMLVVPWACTRYYAYIISDYDTANAMAFYVFTAT